MSGGRLDYSDFPDGVLGPGSSAKVGFMIRTDDPFSSHKSFME